MQTRSAFALPAALLWLSVTAQAGDLQPLEDMTVTEQPPIDAVSARSLTLTGNPATLLHSDAAELLRLVPGVHVSQHTGGAKGLQISLRGFDAEHGQDLAVSLDGIPLNEPSHVHGHGYLDLHFLIPETLDRIDVVKGPWDPRHGNFATAGALDFVSQREAADQRISVRGGRFRSLRGLARLAGTSGGNSAWLAAEAAASEGHTDPGRARSGRLMASGGKQQAHRQWHWIALHYAQRSAAADVVPLPAVEAGQVAASGSLDDSNGVDSKRSLLGLHWEQHTTAGTLRLQPWVQSRRTDIWTNSTGHLRNPAAGDQLAQHDRRMAAGLQASWGRDDTPAGQPLFSEIGLQLRHDRVITRIDETTVRKPHNQLQDLRFRETAAGGYARGDWLPLPRLRLLGGLRFDAFVYDGLGTRDETQFDIATNRSLRIDEVPRQWHTTDTAISPRGSIIMGPWSGLQVFLHYGRGFFTRTSQQLSDSPDGGIAATHSGEAGVRWIGADNRVDARASGWVTRKGADQIHDPLSGRGLIIGSTRRTGLDLELRLRPLDGLEAGLDFTAVDARRIADDTPLPQLPRWLHAHWLAAQLPGHWQALLRGRLTGPRPLSPTAEAGAFYVADLALRHEGPRWIAGFELANLLDRQYHDSIFEYASRPDPEGPARTALHATPGMPRTWRAELGARF